MEVPSDQFHQFVATAAAAAVASSITSQLQLQLTKLKPTTSNPSSSSRRQLRHPQDNRFPGSCDAHNSLDGNHNGSRDPHSSPVAAHDAHKATTALIAARDAHSSTAGSSRRLQQHYRQLTTPIASRRQPACSSSFLVSEILAEIVVYSVASLLFVAVLLDSPFGWVYLDCISLCNWVCDFSDWSVRSGASSAFARKQRWEAAKLEASGASAASWAKKKEGSCEGLFAGGFAGERELGERKNVRAVRATHFSHSGIRKSFSEIALQTRESLKRPYFPLPLSILAVRGVLCLVKGT
ncbi:hypothetical protein VitviT2T_029008 [Vitis vinifera]|uniref:Uncharacterized protein n=1 Tax=Vitis vinifera TaxID=29760 RepID=A0ABY9DV19_VITVI|nr:hypothetical protein VitviT2T_029008 [Vitis vinifera]